MDSAACPVEPILTTTAGVWGMLCGNGDFKGFKAEEMPTQMVVDWCHCRRSIDNRQCKWIRVVTVAVDSCCYNRAKDFRYFAILCDVHIAVNHNMDLFTVINIA